jgi:agmatine/peptidylarginine deiminase
MANRSSGAPSTTAWALPDLAALFLAVTLSACSHASAATRPPSTKNVGAAPAPVSHEVDYFEQALVDAYAESLPLVVLDRTPSTRLLRGDFEAPETLVVVYEPDWRDSVAQIVAAAKGQADVIVLVLPEDRGRSTVRKIRRESHVRVIETRLDSPWVRDYGPQQTYDLADGLVCLDYGYGYDRPEDDAVPQTLAALLPDFQQALLFPENVTLDGGAVISNGKGFCAITEISLTDAGVSEEDSYALQGFMRTLGCPTLAILPELPDETTGHVDVIAQFLSPTVAVVASVDPRADIQMAIALDEATERLAEAAELRGERLSIVRLPMEVDGEAFYSYVNSTRLKNRLLVPDYDRVSPQTQRLAYAKLKSALPTVELVPIKADMMADRGGAVHCVTLGLGPTTTQPTELARPRGRPKPRG